MLPHYASCRACLYVCMAAWCYSDSDMLGPLFLVMKLELAQQYPATSLGIHTLCAEWPAFCCPWRCFAFRSPVVPVPTPGSRFRVSSKLVAGMQEASPRAGGPQSLRWQGAAQLAMFESFLETSMRHMRFLPKVAISRRCLDLTGAKPLCNAAFQLSC